jgi:hypothetical protein
VEDGGRAVGAQVGEDGRGVGDVELGAGGGEGAAQEGRQLAAEAAMGAGDQQGCAHLPVRVSSTTGVRSMISTSHQIDQLRT